MSRILLCLAALTAMSACATGAEILDTVITVTDPAHQPYTILSR